MLLAFDLIALDGKDLRKRRLAKLVRCPQAGIVVNEVFEGSGGVLFRARL